MAKTIGPLVDELLRRVRDPHAMANSRELVRRFLHHAEGIIGTGLRVNQETITFTTERKRLIYVIPDINERIVFLDAVQAEGRDLDFVPFDTLVAEGSGWFRRLSSQFSFYSTVGRELLVLYPGVDRTITITLLAITYISGPLTESDTTTLEDEKVPAILDFAELFLLLRSRRLDALKPTLERLQVLLAQRREL